MQKNRNKHTVIPGLLDKVKVSEHVSTICWEQIDYTIGGWEKIGIWNQNSFFLTYNTNEKNKKLTLSVVTVSFVTSHDISSQVSVIHGM